MQFKRTLVAPGVERGGESNVDDCSRWQRRHLLGLVERHHIQHHTLLGNTKSGVLPLLAEAANGRGQLNCLSVEQRHRIPRPMRSTALQIGHQRWRDLSQGDNGVQMQRGL